MSGPSSLRVPSVIPLSFTAPLPSFVGRAFGIAALNLVTLGLYKPYGITRVRRNLYPYIRVGADVLQYEGDAKGLSRVTFYPSLAFLFLLLGPGVVQFFLSWVGVIALGGLQIILLAAFYQYLFFRNLQYELSNIRWRGRDVSLTGAATKYMLKSLGSLGAVGLTGGILAPWRRAMLARYTYGSLFIGSAPVECEVRARPLLPLYLVGWFLSLIGFGFALWYYVRFGVEPVLTVLQTGAADSAMAGAVDADALSAASGLPGPVPKETLAQIGTFMNGITLAFTLYPAWIVWRLLCLSPYEAAWNRAWAESLRCQGQKLEYTGGILRPFLTRALSFLANFSTANLSRPFTTFFRIKLFCRSFVVVADRS